MGNTTNENITIKEVAKRAGVSVATAGRVLGNYGKVSEATRVKVQNAAEELSFVPNTLAQNMRSRSTKTIGVLVPDIQNNFFGSIISSMERCARRRGYALLICNTGENRDREMESLEMLAQKQVDGLLLASTFHDAKQIPSKYHKMVFERFPVVLYDRKITDMPLISILTDNYNIAYKATKHLIGLGHTHIATIGSERNGEISNTVKMREAGFRAALREIGALDDGISITVDYKNPVEAQKRLNRLLDYHKVTAIIIMNNSLLVGCMEILAERKLGFPDRISIITWDDEEIDKILGITAVKQPVERIGEIAVNTLLDMIEGKTDAKGEATITIDGQIVERNSCKIYREEEAL